MAAAFQSSTNSIGTEAWQGGAIDIQMYGSQLDLFKIESRILKYFNEKEQVVRIADLCLLILVTV